jgi:hypothetical protein
MKDLENVISENAKGILQSTMKEEIGELVKESLMEQDDETDVEPEEDEMDVDDESDVEDTEDEVEIDTDIEDTDMEDDSEDDFEMDNTMGLSDEPIDLTGASDEEILKVFKGMGEEDGIIIKKDDNVIDLEDTEEDVHYKIQMGESDEDYFSDEYSDEDEGFVPGGDMFSEESDEMDEVVYEIEMDEESDEELDEMSDEELDEESDEMDEVVYEIEMDEESDEELDEMYDNDHLEEAFKAKGVKGGKPKFSYKKTTGGFNEKMKQGPKSVGTGSAKKFKYGQGENAGDKLGKNKIVKKIETKEASRTLGAGKYFGKKGLPKPKAAPRHLRVESQEVELNLLREKNEEYRKALNLFRGKLNEVAVFNSNLAYATRLFTEHSTTKQEKINILRRFDSVESLKESKALYKTLKDELSSQSTKKPSKESIQEQIERTPSSGSAANLIESKTYENPQFMRMKDLMVKMNIKN